MNNYKIIYIYLLLVLLISTKTYSQISINTDPETNTALKIKTHGNSAATTGFKVTDSDNANLFTINDNGYIGFGTTDPLVKLDLRSVKFPTDNALGIGDTDLSASAAKAGAIRYHTNGANKNIEYSDGTVWFTLQTHANKAFVVVQNSDGKIITSGSANAAGRRLENWTKLIDTDSSFSQTSGIFTAPRDGIYSVSLSIVSDENTLVEANGRTFEIQLAGVNQTPDDNAFSIVKCINSYMTTTSGIQLTNSCKGFFPMQKNQRIFVLIFQNVNSGGLKMGTDPTLNTMTISEM
ncbi:hypothetical protein [Dysgonomonas macrotermitis]|uniref:C1q domain-containing protein n=1 Tax=Dysgonomonas macrotermitis TaxID=1346286 RepID=A0A1M5CGT8_9BACT|nr:hypothetical protein [Dysgonomonas macrotermitis]SHF53916.1 hypothetical protein SAMN05444362_107165 [Dysgonomonas macrotermitis]